MLLHGGIECGGAYWAPVIERLAEHHHVIVPDAPGLGESAPVDRLDDDTFAGWFGDVLAQTKWSHRPSSPIRSSAPPPHATCRGTAARSASWSSTPRPGSARTACRRRCDTQRSGSASDRPRRNAERFDRFALLDLDATRARDPRWFEAFDAYTRSRAGSARQADDAAPDRLRDRSIPDDVLAGIATQTTLLWGRHDRMVPLRLAERAARLRVAAARDRRRRARTADRAARRLRAHPVAPPSRQRRERRPRA